MKARGEAIAIELAAEDMFAAGSAVAPFIRAVQLVGVERRLGILRKDELVPLCLFRLLRADLEKLRRERPALEIVDDLEAAVFEVSMDGEGLNAIDLNDEQDLRAVVRDIAESLGCRA